MPVRVENIPDLLQWIDNGLTLDQMGAKLGSKGETVHAFLRKNNIPYENRGRKAERNGRWKGGRIIDEDGYVLIKDHSHPHSDRHNYVREHRLVMEKFLGRYLDPKEVVHHADGNRQNNQIDNLKLFAANNLHLASTLAGKIPNWTEEGKVAISLGASKRRPSTRKQTKHGDEPLLQTIDHQPLSPDTAVHSP